MGVYSIVGYQLGIKLELHHYFVMTDNNMLCKKKTVGYIKLR